MGVNDDLKVYGGVIVPMGKAPLGKDALHVYGGIPVRGSLDGAMQRLGDLDLAQQIQFLAGVIVSLSHRIEALEADRKK